MFMQKQKKDWCDRQIHSDEWCDNEVTGGVSMKTVDDKSLYEGPTKAAWQLDSSVEPPSFPWALSQKQDWCDSGIHGTDWCAQEEAKDLNERTKQQKGLMFAQKQKKDWCDRQIHSDEWCDNEVTGGLSMKTVDDKSLYEGPTKAAWQLDSTVAPPSFPWALSQKAKQDWCDSGIHGTDWCAQEEAKDLNERTKQQKGLMFTQKEKKDWCDRQIHSDEWCDKEVEGGHNMKTVDDKSLYEGPTKAAWQLDPTVAPPSFPWALSQKTKKDWCDRQIHSDEWCDKEVDGGHNMKTVDDKSLYEGPTKAAWQLDPTVAPPSFPWALSQRRVIHH